MALVYKATYIDDGRVYVGGTIQSLEGRIRGHIRHMKDVDNPKRQSRFNKALRELGFDNFEWEIIEDGILSEVELDEKETFYVAEYKSNDPQFGFNDQTGGKRGFKSSEEARKKSGLSQKGRVMTEEQKKHLSEINTGKKASPETRAKLSASLKGKNLGKKASEETRRKISIASKGRPSATKGTHISEERKEHLSEINRKLTDAQVLEIKDLLLNGETQQSIADKYGVTRVTISRIKTGGICYRHLWDDHPEYDPK